MAASQTPEAGSAAPLFGFFTEGFVIPATKARLSGYRGVYWLDMGTLEPTLVKLQGGDRQTTEYERSDRIIRQPELYLRGGRDHAPGKCSLGLRPPLSSKGPPGTIVGLDQTVSTTLIDD